MLSYRSWSKIIQQLFGHKCNPTYNPMVIQVMTAIIIIQHIIHLYPLSVLNILIILIFDKKKKDAVQTILIVKLNV